MQNFAMRLNKPTNRNNVITCVGGGFPVDRTPHAARETKPAPQPKTFVMAAAAKDEQAAPEPVKEPPVVTSLPIPTKKKVAIDAK